MWNTKLTGPHSECTVSSCFSWLSLTCPVCSLPVPLSDDENWSIGLTRWYDGMFLLRIGFVVWMVFYCTTPYHGRAALHYMLSPGLPPWGPFNRRTQLSTCWRVDIFDSKLQQLGHFPLFINCVLLVLVSNDMTGIYMASQSQRKCMWWTDACIHHFLFCTDEPWKERSRIFSGSSWPSPSNQGASGWMRAFLELWSVSVAWDHSLTQARNPWGAQPLAIPLGKSPSVVLWKCYPNPTGPSKHRKETTLLWSLPLNWEARGLIRASSNAQITPGQTERRHKTSFANALARYGREGVFSTETEVTGNLQA